MIFKIKLIASAIVALVTLGGIIFGLNYLTKTYIDGGRESNQNFQNTSFDLNLLKSGLQGSDTLNVLLLGVSGQNHISGDLTDTIMVANIGLESEKINLISIPRDLWVSNNGEKQKINELYRQEGGTDKPKVEYAKKIKQKIAEITGLRIHYAAIIDLDGIKNIVDLIEGVNTEEGFKNGDEALVYIRDRSRPGSDFGRMKRQQKLIIDIVNKITENQQELLEDQNRISELLALVEENISTDMSILELFSLSGSFSALDVESIGLHTITTNNLLQEEYRDINGQSIYILYPRAGEEDYSEIKNFVEEILNL